MVFRVSRNVKVLSKPLFLTRDPSYYRNRIKKNYKVNQPWRMPIFRKSAPWQLEHLKNACWKPSGLVSSILKIEYRSNLSKTMKWILQYLSIKPRWKLYLPQRDEIDKKIQKFWVTKFQFRDEKNSSWIPFVPKNKFHVGQYFPIFLLCLEVVLRHVTSFLSSL